MEIAELKTLAIAAAKAAGDILLANYGTVFSRHYKDGEPANTCTEVDLAANNCIMEMLQNAAPNHAILSEEAPLQEGSSSYTWVVDPLDGTNNFLHGIPQFSVSIALFKDEEPLLGVVYQPIGDILFYAERGAGAWRNDTKLTCSLTTELSEAMVGLGFYYDRGTMMKATLSCIEDFFRNDVHGIRRMGCASLDLCYVAAGYFDIFFEYTLSPWDFAAGMLVVTEAGGRISTAQNQPLGLCASSVLATNTLLHEKAQAIVGSKL